MLQRIRDGLQGQKWLAWIILGAHWPHVRFLGWFELPGLLRRFEHHRGRSRRRRNSRRAKPRAPGAIRRRAGRGSSAPTFPPSSGWRCSRTSSTAWCCASSSRNGSTTRTIRVSDATVLAEFQNIPAVPWPGRQVRRRHRALGARADQQVRRRVLRRNPLAVADQPAAAGHRRLVLPHARRSSSACSISKTKNAKCSTCSSRPTSSPAASRSTMPPSRPTTTRTAIAS